MHYKYVVTYKLIVLVYYFRRAIVSKRNTEYLVRRLLMVVVVSRTVVLPARKANSTRRGIPAITQAIPTARTSLLLHPVNKWLLSLIISK